MAIAQVQNPAHASTPTGSATAAATFGANVTKGSSLVLAVGWGGVVTITNFSVETWTLVKSAIFAGVGTSSIYWVQSAVGGWTTLTITFSGTGTGGLQIGIWELSSLLGPDSTSQNNATSTTPTSTNITPKAGGEFFVNVENGNGLISAGPTNGYTGFNDGASGGFWGVAGLIATDSAAHGTSWTIASQPWGMIDASFFAQPSPQITTGIAKPATRQPNFANNALQQGTPPPIFQQWAYPTYGKPIPVPLVREQITLGVIPSQPAPSAFATSQPSKPITPLPDFANIALQPIAAAATPNAVFVAEGIVLPLPPKQIAIAGRPPFPLSIKNPYWPIPYIGRASEASDLLPSPILRLLGDVGPR